MTITSIINEATKLITSFILWVPLFFFFWMIIDIMATSGNPEKRKQANQRITWAVIAMFVLLSIGGILALLNQTFFSSNSALSSPPGSSANPFQGVPGTPTPGSGSAPAPSAPSSGSTPAPGSGNTPSAPGSGGGIYDKGTYGPPSP